MSNFIQLEGRTRLSNIFNNYYIYIDTKDYKADRIFIGQQLWFKIKKEWHNPESNYCIILIRTKKRDEDKFKKCMDLLSQKQLICNNSSYMEDATAILGELVDRYLCVGRR